jgi:L-fuculose-phosphate aldolase
MQMHEIRRSIVAACLELDRLGLNQGTSGNVSVRCGDAMIVTPTATTYGSLAPDMLASMRIADDEGRWSGPKAPSSEWRFHRDVYRARPDVGAVVHGHATYATVLSMLRVGIPAAHYMIAAFGGAAIACTDYAAYGTPELSALAVEGLGPRHGVLLGSHGMIVTGADLDAAMWRAVELETLAKQFYLARAIGQPAILPDEEIEGLIPRFASYGASDKA